MRLAAAAALSALLFVGCGGDEQVSREPPPPSEQMTIVSPAIRNDGPIPRPYTCEGRNISPPLSWRGTPGDARELALLVEDPDAPGGTFVHWVVFGIDPGTDGLGPGARLDNARRGRNSAGETRYSGPCPPPGDSPHRYVFSVYALRAPIDLADGAAAGEVRAQIREKATATGRLTGRFGR